MSQRIRRSIGLLLFCCWFVGCSEESADNPSNNLTDAAVSDTSTTEDASTNTSDNGADNGSSGGDSSAVCGNGQIEEGEECDDGPDNSDELSDACRTNCRNATCGDGIVDDEALSETCDDGNSVDDDGCSNLCRLPSCGDGVLQTDEQCDDGSQNSDTRPDACRSNCTSARCGDSVTDANEDCDDGNDLNNDACLSCVNARCGDGFIRQNVETCDDQNGSGLDGCSDLCRLEQGFSCESEPSVCSTTCGDGVIGGLETCDDANDVGGDYCNPDCSAVIGRCGDNIQQSNEACDDGNILNGDDCAANCQTISGFCGDGQIQTNEVCDDGNNNPDDYCAANCQSITGTCGDDTQQTNETCDDGNALAGDYCAANCLQVTGFCGDGTQQSNEACDDGNTANLDYCAPDCQAVTGRCGDGIPQTNEQCDDGNTTFGDYCSSGCVITGACGDGLIQAPAGEVCDDVNTSNNDGCNATCTATEPGWNCVGIPTNCTPILCLTDEYVENNTCIDCPPGTNNEAGDNSSQADTTCDVIFCAENEHVQSNVCVACPPGRDNLAGDDATGPDTLCDIVFCGPNQRVQNNTCVSCASGFVNEAGDDATGSDTTCDADPCYPVLAVYCADFEQAYIKASNTGGNDNFGYAIALDGDTLAVGALTEDSNATGINGDQVNNSAVDSGAVYVFVRSGTTWTQQAYIKASNAGGGDNFGASVALSGDTLTVGAYGEDSNATGINGNQADNSALQSGAVYVFTRSGTAWTQQAYIKASNAETGDAFGRSVALSGDTLAVGATYEKSIASGVNGNQADNSAANGAVYVFVRSGTTWTQQAYIKASNTDTTDVFGDSFGQTVALDGDTLAVGADREDSNATGVNGNQTDNSALESGAIYVFVRSGTTWTQQAYIKASNTGANDSFGQSIALFGDTLAVSAIREDSAATGINGNQGSNSVTDSGAVYVFVRSGTTWTQQAYVKASNTGGSLAADNFGSSVALFGDTLAVGARSESSNATGVNGSQADNSANSSGAIYLFTRSGTTWSQKAYIKASNTEASDGFGNGVALSGDTLAVSASNEDSNATGINGDQSNNASSGSGAVYIRKITP